MFKYSNYCGRNLHWTS